MKIFTVRFESCQLRIEATNYEYLKMIEKMSFLRQFHTVSFYKYCIILN